MWMMRRQSRWSLLAALLALAVSACGVSDGAPSVTESETGRVVGHEVEVDAFRVDVTEQATAVFVVTGTVPSSCYEAVFGFEEPSSDGVMIGSTESLFDPTCRDEGAAEFSVSMELTDLAPDDYVARLDETFEARFSIPDKAADEAAQDSAAGNVPGGAPVVMADWAASPFEGIVQSSDVVIVGTIQTVDPITKWSTPDGALEPTYSSGDMPGGLPEEWQELTVSVDQVIVDIRGSVSTTPVLVRYQVTQPGYQPISVSQLGAQILVSAFFSRVPYTDGSIVEQLTLDPQGTYLETTTGDMAQLFSVVDGSYYSARGRGQSDCSEADLVTLDELVTRATGPSADKTKWLGYGEEPSPCPTAAVPATGELVVPSCQDNAMCPLAFVLNDVSYTVSCAAIQESAVTDDIVGSGDFHGDNVTVHRIDGVDDSVMVALSVPGGFCSENDPDERHTPWSMAFADGANDEQLSDAVCQVGELSAAQRLANGCHLGQELLTCGSGPGFPPDVPDDLTVYPEPTDSFGADIAALLGTDDPDELVGWHVIVEERQSDGSYIQLLLREDPNSRELQYLLDGSAETFDAPRRCEPEALD